jgi:hypothetical protein
MSDERCPKCGHESCGAPMSTLDDVLRDCEPLEVDR